MSSIRMRGCGGQPPGGRLSCINNGHRALAQGEGETMLPAVPLDLKLALDLEGFECTCIKAHVHEGSCGIMGLIS